jgi:hypothetical protein
MLQSLMKIIFCFFDVGTRADMQRSDFNLEVAPVFQSKKARLILSKN